MAAVTLCALALLVVAPHSQAQRPGRPQARAQQQLDTTFAVEPGGRLRVDGHQGSVRIRSWDQARIRVAASHPSRVRVRIRRAGDAVRLEAEAIGDGRARSVHYEITVPRTFGVVVDGMYVETSVENVDGPIRIENVQGDITVRGGRGDLDLESVDGEIVVSNVRGRVGVEGVNQAIRVTDVIGTVDVDAVNGSIQLSGIQSDSVAAESLNGNIVYAGTIRDGGRYHFSTHNGSLRVTVPERTNATVRVATHNGDVQSDFPVQPRRDRRGDRVTFILGSGSARLELESFAGTIRLLRPGGANR